MAIVKIGDLSVVQPDWNAPKNIKAFTTTRIGGKSHQPFDSFNLALNIDENRDATINNREQLIRTLKLPEPPRWVSQTHSTIVHDVSQMEATCEADATFTTETHQVCAILTADCLPILLTNQQGSFVAAIHAGWRGLLNGILENTLKVSSFSNHTMMAWLAPAISQKAFEVGPEVREAFLCSDESYESFFINSTRTNHYFADLYGIARQKLENFGIPKHQISGGDHCTYTDATHFYSHRRDGKDSGRQATLIWMEGSI
ncbi:peptidoglycan editing factor PgeF [Wohlfahrtiimonas larvae]|uniref:Purine nucleoside phosphorylase n=1 Tax=Wohlfahrtiimonas larvae TaxID=1157986 RepID=A0ABP9MLY6_9GAMM|nr:peptidoglycan editing factor PgeF [Wohlfahrtiimonas larvae]